MENDNDKHKNWLKVLALADEALKRKLAAAKALDLGWGGISTVARISGMFHYDNKERDSGT